MSTLQNELAELKSAAEKMPSPEKIRDILRLVSRGAPYDQLFFEKLDDPSWLPILDRHEYFSNLPDVKTTDDGRQFFAFHLPLIGLGRLASKAPHAVASVLAKIKPPKNNPMVGDQLLRCIGSIREKTCVPVLHSLLGRLAENSNHLSWVWIQELIKTWMQLEMYPDVLIAINTFLGTIPGIGANPSRIGDPWSIQEVDKIAMEPLTSQYSLQIATITFSALSRWSGREQFGGMGEISSGIDVESYLGDNTSDALWLEDFRGASSYRETEGTLARRLFLTAEQIMQQGDDSAIEQLDQLLRSNSSGLFNRLRWQIYADFPELSFDRARHDVVLRIPYLNRIEFTHNYEFAQMLQVFTKRFNNRFLSEGESNQIFEVVLSGPIDKSDRPVDEDYRRWFQRRQLWPILEVLDGNQRNFYSGLKTIGELSLQAYKPGSLGEVHSIKQVAPPEAQSLSANTDEELWNLLNTWKPSSQATQEPWIQEDFGFLVKSFAELVERDRNRFSAEKKWWQQIQRPEPFIELLNRAIERIQKKQEEVQKPTNDDWAMWFGLAWWIVLQSPDGVKRSRSSDWYWSRIVACNFITAAFQSHYSEVSSYVAESGQLLRKLAENEDSGLKDLNETRFDSWLTTAINTVRGHAIEGILKLALRQKNSKEEISPWIFDFVCSRLAIEDESPAVFALIGANLRLFVHLFGERLKTMPELLFPPQRPSQKRAAIVSHFCYDHPMTGLINTFPNLLDEGLSTLREIVAKTANEKQKNNPRDFASQLGIHIGFYYWNNAFEDERIGDAIIDTFFSVALPDTRAVVVGQIAWIFRGAAKKDNERVIARVMRIWERRIDQIINRIDAGAPVADYEGELDRFLDWLGCECFPLTWRFDYVRKAIARLQKLRDLFRVFHTLYEWETNYPERLETTLQLLVAVLGKPSDQLRWSIQSNKLAPIMVRGLQSNEPHVTVLAERCQELLLKMGFFDVLELDRSLTHKQLNLE